MANDFAGFSASMRARAAAVSVNADRLVRRIALVADQAIVDATPVDTGRARSNWIVTLDSAAGGTRAPYVEGLAGSSASANAQAAIEQGAAVVATYSGDAHREIHITNNLPYIDRLNNGWSRQAPAEFVQEALHTTAAAFNGMVLSVQDGVPR